MPVHDMQVGGGMGVSVQLLGCACIREHVHSEHVHRWGSGACMCACTRDHHLARNSTLDKKHERNKQTT